MAFVVITVGADLGVLSPTAFLWLVAIALFTTVITTPLLRRAYPRPKKMEGWEATAAGGSDQKSCLDRRAGRRT